MSFADKNTDPIDVEDPTEGLDLDTLDLESSRGRLLLSAIKEFASRGLQGGRMEAIAKDAGVNKALVYRYFRTKERLFSTALRFKFTRRYRVAQHSPDGVPDALEYWFRHSADDPSFLAILHREALNPDAAAADESYRKAYYAEWERFIVERKDRGEFDAKFDPRMLLLAISALVSFPAFFPQITKLISGRRHDDPAFKKEWSTFLRQLAVHLALHDAAEDPAPGPD